MDIPTDYVIRAIYAHCKRPLHKPYHNSYNAECPICREGSSAGKKRRLFYFPNGNYFYCHNCNQSWNSLDWLVQVTRQPVSKILKDCEYKDISQETPVEIKPVQELPDLPEDSIDLMNPLECEYYKEDEGIQGAIQYCANRRLFTAVNRPKSLYYSKEDFVHKGRLIIPFYDLTGKVCSYQSRLLENRKGVAKYLSKLGGKGLFGENTIDSSIPYVFIFEGPIDAMFVRNGVAIGGATPTYIQRIIIDRLKISHKCIYVLDNDKDNPQMDCRKRQIIDEEEYIFIWPKALQKFKDLNEVCMSLELDQVSPEFIAKNSWHDVEALVRL